MLKLESNEVIGEYLRSKINSSFKNVRSFCKAYLKLRDNTDTVSDEEIRKLQNRFSQILKGVKRIQIDDLPFVTKLLDISCEDVLSAGQTCIPSSNRVTNYSIAFSKDPKAWQEYIERDDKLILNYDEYGKTVLDYAYQFGNYPFIKYLIDKNYIRFIEPSGARINYAYGAETTIQRRSCSDTDVLGAHIKYQDDLRMNVITLAMENKDYTVLESLRARETPMMQFCAISNSTPPLPEYYDCSRLVKAVSTASDEVLDYFSGEYSIITARSNTEATFVFQHLDLLIEAMLKSKDRRVTSVIEAATDHNKKVRDRITAIIDEASLNTMKTFNCSKDEALNMLYYFSYFHDNCGALSFGCDGSAAFLASNVICYSLSAKDETKIDSSVLSALQDLNKTCEDVKALLSRRN